MMRKNRIVTAVNLSTQEEMTFMDVSPAHAVAYAYHDQTNKLSIFLKKTEDGYNWNDAVSKGNYTVIMGDWCALSTAIDTKRPPKVGEG